MPDACPGEEADSPVKCHLPASFARLVVMLLSLQGKKELFGPGGTLQSHGKKGLNGPPPLYQNLWESGLVFVF